MSVCSDAPKVTVAPRDQHVADNGIVSFFCKASGNPAPDVHWRKDGRRVSTARTRYSTVNMPHGNVLRVEPVRAARDHDNSVECVADNGVGEPATAAATLSVYPEGQGALRLSVCRFAAPVSNLPARVDNYAAWRGSVIPSQAQENRTIKQKLIGVRRVIVRVGSA